METPKGVPDGHKLVIEREGDMSSDSVGFGRGKLRDRPPHNFSVFSCRDLLLLDEAYIAASHGVFRQRPHKGAEGRRRLARTHLADGE